MYLPIVYIGQAARDFTLALFRAYQEVHNCTGEGEGTYDSNIRRGGSSKVADRSIVASVACDYLKAYRGYAFYGFKDEAKKSLRWLLEHQEPDGRWERGITPGPTLDEAFDTADCVEALSWGCKSFESENPAFAESCKLAAIKGARWLIQGEILGVYTKDNHKGPPLDALLAFANANYTGSILRALSSLYLVHPDKAWIEALKKGACSLIDWQNGEGTWDWYEGAGVFKTTYHDLTLWGLLKAYEVLYDRRLEGPIRAGLAYLIERQEQGTDRDGTLLESKENLTLRWRSGLRSAAACLKVYPEIPSLSEFTCALAWGLVRTPPACFKGTAVSATEQRLVLLRSMGEFLPLAMGR